MHATEEFWNGRAGDKWVASQPLMDAVLAPFAEVLLEAAELPESGVLVDVGCGCGATTLLASRRRPGLEVIGVDVSAPMLSHARRRAEDEGLSSVRFEHADAAVARPAPAVDRIISRFGIMFFPQPEVAFGNMRRWLRPGGRLTGLVWGAVAKNPWTADLLEVVRRHVEVPAPTEDGPGPFGLSDPDRLERILRGAGFTEVMQRDLDLPMRIPGSLEVALDFHLERGMVDAALAEADQTVAAALRDDLRDYVEQRYDGEATELRTRARLVRADVAG